MMALRDTLVSDSQNWSGHYFIFILAKRVSDLVGGAQRRVSLDVFGRCAYVAASLLSHFMIWAFHLSCLFLALEKRNSSAKRRTVLIYQ